MTVRERVLASRLVDKIDAQSRYAQRIGLSYKLDTESASNEGNTSVKNTSNKNKGK